MQTATCSFVVDSNYCPWLPFIAAACLHWMSEKEAYGVCAALITHYKVMMSRADSWSMLIAFADLVHAKLPDHHHTIPSKGGSLGLLIERLAV